VFFVKVVLLYSAVIYLGAFAHMPFVRIAGPLSLLAVASVVQLFRTRRRLLGAGYGFDDVRVALHEEMEAPREEIGLSKADEDRLRRAWRFQLAGAVAMAMGLAVVPGALAMGGAGMSELGAAAGAALVIGGVVLISRSGRGVPREQRRGQLSRWFNRTWEGRLGQWFFALAEAPEALARFRQRLGGTPVPALTALPSAGSSAGAHTEVVLARAAEDLFEALPSAARARLGEGREVIERLRVQIAALRKREEQFESALAQAGEPRAASSPGLASAPQTLLARRLEVTNELEQARRDMAARRASAVAALENIRIQLLRLRTGLGSPADLTSDLEAGREIERQISAIIEVSDIIS
jgi:hypothetical protein